MTTVPFTIVKPMISGAKASQGTNLASKYSQGGVLELILSPQGENGKTILSAVPEAILSATTVPLLGISYQETTFRMLVSYLSPSSFSCEGLISSKNREGCSRRILISTAEQVCYPHDQ